MRIALVAPSSIPPVRGGAERAVDGLRDAIEDLTPHSCDVVRVPVDESSLPGVIAGYRAEVDPETLGLGLQAFVRVQLKSHDAARIAVFAEQVNGWAEIVACHALTGDMDYLLHVVVRDLEHFSRFLLDKLLSQAEVADVNTSFVLRTVKRAQALPLAGDA